MSGKNTRPTAAQLGILSEMTMGDKRLHAYPALRRTTAHHYVLHDASGDYYHTVSMTTVHALLMRGLIAEVRTSIYALEWTYRVTEAGRAAVKAAMEPHEA